MSFSTFFSLRSLSQDRERTVSVAMSKRGLNTTSNDGSLTAEARPIDLVMHSQCKEEISSQSSGSLVNPGNDDERRTVGLASGNCGSFDSNFEVECSQVSRQEKVILASRKLGRRTKPKQKVRRTSLAQGNLMHHYQMFWRHAILESSIHGKFQCMQKKLGRSALDATVSKESYKTRVLVWWTFMASSMKATIHLGPGFLDELGNLQESEIREHWEYVQHYSKIDKRTFRRNSKCERPGTFITIMDEIDIGERSSDQMGEGKSMCLRWLFSVCWSDWKRSRSGRKKMERVKLKISGCVHHIKMQ